MADRSLFRFRYEPCLIEINWPSEDDMRTEGDMPRAIGNKRIFVVESDEVIRSALQFILEDENETHVLTSLEQTYAASDRWKPDLVLLGMSMIRHLGVLVLDAVRARLPEAKILLVADSRDDPLALLCLAAGADGVLGKPITHASVCDTVDWFLGRRKPSQPSLNTSTVSPKLS